MSNISTVLRQAIAQLPHSPSAQLDAEILLAQALQVTRTYLYTWPDRVIPESALHLFAEWIKRRQHGEPVAYIIGEREFWSLPFYVSTDTLIPRPETELLVEQVLNLLPQTEPCRVLDLGTGSGAIAVAVAASRPHWQVLATDISAATLKVAAANAVRHQLNNVQFLQSDWFESIPAGYFHAIVSNPPYIAQGRPELNQGDVAYEPQLALTAGSTGLDAIRVIIQETPSHLSKDGWLLLEHGYDQGAAVNKLLVERGFVEVSIDYDLAGLSRVSCGKMC